MTWKKRSTGEMRPHPKMFRSSCGFIWAVVSLLTVTTAMSVVAQGKSEQADRDKSGGAKRQRPASTKIPLDRSTDAYQITENGPHHRKWERVETRTNEAGEEEEIIHRYTELGIGLNRWNGEKGEWVDSSEVIVQFRGGAAALGGQQQVIFGANINVEGAIDILNPDGVRIRSSVLGLAYFDAISGEDVVIAEVKPSVGEILPPNQIIYRDAFEGLEADVLYTYKRTGLVQDVILREQPPSPELWGFPKVSSRLEVITEMFDVEEPSREALNVLRKVDDPEIRSKMAEPDFRDETLRFGEMRMTQGTAFGHPQESRNPIEEVPVGKKWDTIEGRQILFESVEYEAIEEDLKRLPKASRSRAMLRKKGSGDLNPTMASVSLLGSRRLPRRIDSQPNEPQNAVMLAQNDLKDRAGYVIDYTTVVGAFLNYTFKRGETYLISGTVYLYGVTTFEGGIVVKHDNSTLRFSGPVQFETSEYSPAVFTSKHDDTIGKIVTGSSGTPPAFPYNSTFLHFNYVSSSELRNIQMRYCQTGIYIYGGVNLSARNLQISHSKYAFSTQYHYTLNLENVLLDDFDYGLYAQNGAIVASNLTAHDGSNLLGPSLPILKNSLLVDVTTTGNYHGKGDSHNIEVSNPAGVFQSAGGGHFYLSNSSPYRDSATASIDQDFADWLESKTTYPPTELSSGTVLAGNSTTWTPHVARDDDGALDIGYHYMPIDYLVDSVHIGPDYQSSPASSHELLIDAGTVVAAKGNVGLYLHSQSSLKFQGEPGNPVRYVVSELVQEQGQWALTGELITASMLSSRQPVNSLEMRFTEVSSLPLTRIIHSQPSLGNGVANLVVRDSALYSGEVVLGGGSSWTMDYLWQNNLLDTVSLQSVNGSKDFQFSNNLFLGGEFEYVQSGGTWLVRDNLFDGFEITSGSTIQTGSVGYNGYLNTSHRLGGATQSSDIVLGALAYQTGTFGNYYQPASSPLIDSGSRLSDAAGLMHHTVEVGGLPEGEMGAISVVDIGLHYPALNSSSGEPLDLDGDEIVNVLEDLNGNGVVDPGESPWNYAPPSFQVFTPLD